MKILDRYILKKFIGTFIYSISLLSVIIIVFDISEKLEEFIDRKAPLKGIIFEFYLNYLPFLINYFSALFTFISVIFFTSRMASRTEIASILGSGVSFYRFLFPYFLGATIITSLSLFLNNSIIPQATKKRLVFEEKYYKNPFTNYDIHIHMQIEPGTFIYMYQYNNAGNTGYKFSLEKFEGQKMKLKIMAESIQWDSLNSRWRLENVVKRTISDSAETLARAASLDTSLQIHPRDFGRKGFNIESMNYHELNQYIADEKMKGNPNTEKYEIEKYRRFSFPFATYILTLIGVSLSSRKVRGGIGMHIAFGLLISFAFIIFMQVSTTFAIGGYISPLLSVWIPHILFGIISIFLLRLAPK